METRQGNWILSRGTGYSAGELETKQGNWKLGRGLGLVSVLNIHFIDNNDFANLNCLVRSSISSIDCSLKICSLLVFRFEQPPSTLTMCMWLVCRVQVKERWGRGGGWGDLFGFPPFVASVKYFLTQCKQHLKCLVNCIFCIVSTFTWLTE